MAVRRLAAIMFTDIAGYTALMQEDERHTANIRSRHRQALETHHGHYHGTLIQYYGDGSLSLFNSVIEAVECAMAIQRDLQSDPKVPLRIGLHLGDVVLHDDGDVYGDGVNLASRVESLGVPGNILLSARVNQELRNHSHIQTQSLGFFDFKNVKEPVEVFAVSNKNIRIPQRAELKGKLARKTKTVAVLPFVNMSPDLDNEYFCDGMAEEILNALVKVDGLQVTARTSSFAFKGKNMDVREVGRILNVGHILEGSVRRAGNRVRITVQLINSVDGYHFFSEVYDRNLEDIFAVQDEISQKIAHRLRQHLGEDPEQTPLVKAPTQNIEAYETYLKGLYEFNQWGSQAAIKAKPYFEKAVALQEDFSMPHAYLSICYLFFAFGGQMSWAAAYDKAMPLLQRALELDPDSVDALISLGVFQTFLEWDWQALKRTIDKLKALNPGRGDVYHVMATYHNIMGDIDAAIELERAGLQLDPLSIQQNLYLGLLFTWKEAYALGQKHLDKVLELAPGHRTSLEIKGLNLTLQGKFDEALEYFQQIEPEIGYRLHRSTYLGYVYAQCKETEKAQERLQQLKVLEEKEQGFNPSLDLAVIYAGMGEADNMFHYLEKALSQKLGDSMMFHIDAFFKPYKEGPRFQVLKRKIGIPE